MSVDVVRVRYRAGLVGETRRTVHVATSLPGGVFRTLCALVIRAEDAEVFEQPAGAPCMSCTRTLALAAAPESAASEPVELGSARREFP